MRTYGEVSSKPRHNDGSIPLHTAIDVESHDELDQIWMAGVPMARYLELKEVLPVREYEAFADDVRRRWQQQTA